ncbi:MAG: hypothetical protein GC154_10630 [bacterium]|nr:hypothetical protein [bacterium]
MNELYEILPQYRALNDLMRHLDEPFDPEAGSRVYWRGAAYRVIGSNKDRIVLIAEPVILPIQPDDLIHVDGWEEDGDFIYLPSNEELLDILRRRTSLFPMMTPGVKATREVWQVKHPEADPVVCKSLTEALLETTLAVISQQQ